MSDTCVPSAEPVDENYPIDQDGFVNEDIPCVRCSYNLRTLHMDAVCPECSTPVGRSLRGDFLQYSDPDWVERLARGMNWIAASRASGTGVKPTGSSELQGLATLIAGIVSFIGYWLLTTPEPRQVNQQPGARARAVARICAVITIALSPFSLAVNYLNPLAVLSWLAGLIGLVQMFAIFIYVRQLALRIPDQGLARHTRIVMWGLLASMGSLVAVGLLAVMSAILLGPAAATIGIFACLSTPVMLVFAIWALILLLRYRKALGIAAARARASWATAEAR